jgi:hypothetical protein
MLSAAKHPLSPGVQAQVRHRAERKIRRLMKGNTQSEDLLRLSHGEQVAYAVYGCDRRPDQAGVETQAKACSGLYVQVQHQAAGVLRGFPRHSFIDRAGKAIEGMAALEENRLG